MGTVKSIGFVPELTAGDVEAAERLLTSAGAAVMRPADVTKCIAIANEDWTTFASHWDGLAPDGYAEELGTHRLRRYGQFLFRAGVATPVSHDAFVQPENSNPLYVGRERHFQPLTEAFATDPLLHALLKLLGRLAAMLDDRGEFSAKVTPFRVLAAADSPGQATPEGMHRDGVTLVTSLLVSRRNARGGGSTVVNLQGRRLLATTLCEPGTLLMADDRRTLHGVSPIEPVDPTKPAVRDVLVITFAPPCNR
jgi:hypothetical protein